MTDRLASPVRPADRSDMREAAQGAAATRPAHVPPHLVVDFDCLAPAGWADDVHRAWHIAQQRLPDLFWTPRNGGHWVAMRGDLIRMMQRDNARFSHAKYVVPFDAAIPPAPPATSDAPLHARYRALIVPGLLPAVINTIAPEVRALARETIAMLAPRGECEFIGEFAQMLPIGIFLRLVDLPVEDRPRLLEFSRRAARPASTDERIAAHAGMRDYLPYWIGMRRTTPGDDLLSAIVTGRIGDRAVDDEEALGLCSTLLFGGLDTVASMMGFFARHLAEQPALRQRLARDPARIPDAVEELIRRFGVANTARMVSRDMEVAGVEFRRGEQILLPNPLYGLDERITPDPMTVDLDRPGGSRHVAFGTGAHACPGAMLARREFRIFLEEWLSAIPDFEIRPGTAPELGTGTINSVLRLDLVWRTSG